MNGFDVELVGKIGSMALIERKSNRLNYSRIAALADELRPGYIWVTSGATEIGRLDYIRRTGKELTGSAEDNKTDYSAQGQAILMQTTGSSFIRIIPSARCSSNTGISTSRKSGST